MYAMFGTSTKIINVMMRRKKKIKKKDESISFIVLVTTKKKNEKLRGKQSRSIKKVSLLTPRTRKYELAINAATRRSDCKESGREICETRHRQIQQ